MATVVAPCRPDRVIGSRTSSVSPLCEIPIATSPLPSSAELASAVCTSLQVLAPRPIRCSRRRRSSATAADPATAYRSIRRAFEIASTARPSASTSSAATVSSSARVSARSRVRSTSSSESSGPTSEPVPRSQLGLVRPLSAASVRRSSAYPDSPSARQNRVTLGSDVPHRAASCPIVDEATAAGSRRTSAAIRACAGLSAGSRPWMRASRLGGGDSTALM